MDDGNLAVLVDAKTEYTKQLVNVLKGYMYGVFLELFNETSEEYPENIFFEYQKKLSQIPKWNTEMINDHCEALIAKSKCDWIDELVTAVFVSHTRILTSINFSKNKGKIDLNIPKTNNFIHKCFIDIKPDTSGRTLTYLIRMLASLNTRRTEETQKYLLKRVLMKLSERNFR